MDSCEAFPRRLSTHRQLLAAQATVQYASLALEELILRFALEKSYMSFPVEKHEPKG